MKSTGLVFTALVFVGGLVLAAGCIGSATEQSPEGNWILTSFGSGSTAEHPIGIISLDILSGNVTGNSGVNNYRGTVTVDTAAGKLTLSPLVTTRMAGPENLMMQEQTYLAAMAKVTGYKSTDGSLILTDKDGNILLTFAVMPKDTLAGTAWTADESADVTLEFGADGSFNGQGPVNLYFGSWYVTGTNGIAFSPVGSTLMAGPVDQMTAETEFFGKLANVTGYKIVDGKLTLTGKDETTLLTFREGIPESDIPLNGNWTLTTNKNVTIDFTTSGKVNGQAPVNRYFGNVTITGTSIKFSEIGSTRMAGPEDQMKAETEFFEKLSNVTGYTLGSGSLKLLDKDGETLLTFVRPVNTPAEKSLPDVEKTGLTNEWTLTGSDTVTLNLMADGSFHGRAPVNNYFGSYTETGESLAFGAVGATLMAGPEDQMTAETEFFTALGNVTGYKVVDGKLFLTDAAGNTVLTFE